VIPAARAAAVPRRCFSEDAMVTKERTAATLRQVWAFAVAAANAGDMAACAVCQIAAVGDARPETLRQLPDAELRGLAGMTQQRARELVGAWIADAAAARGDA